jgi:dipeptidyl aminopeptidase/acylaminoacyl peptidase
VTADLVVEASTTVVSPMVAGTDVYWLENRPHEDGRVVIVRRTESGTIADVIAQPWSARTSVHEYGGGEYWVHGTTVFFANWGDQRVYRVDGDGEGHSTPTPVTPEPSFSRAFRFADGIVVGNGQWVICVRQSHESPTEPTDGVHNEIVAFPADGRVEPRVLVSGPDFVSFPRVSPDGTQLAWTQWDDPNMPWDGCELWVADLTISEDGPALAQARRVAGSATESIFQPEWSPSGALHFVSDRTGWWNLYRHDPAGNDVALCPMDAEFGVPQWQFASATYTCAGDDLVCIWSHLATDHIGVLDGAGALREIAVPFTVMDMVRPHGNGVVFQGTSPYEHRVIAHLDVVSGAVTVLSPEMPLPFDRAYISAPEPIEFPTAGNRTAHALYYAPVNPAVTGPDGELPPVAVMIHGGPTSMATPRLDLAKQYFTSRGIAVVDVNYGGSTGYGREYRDRLKGQWGVVDVDDCVAAAQYLAEQGLVDGSRAAIRGGSAGGYTTLAALAFRDYFAAGANYFGVADTMIMAKETHKFEARYLDALVAPVTDEKLHYERSPINFVDRIDCPLIVFQGLEDAVVPPNQSEMIVAALADRGIPHAYLAFDGEQHGFRKAATIKRCLEAEAYFYSRILGFELEGVVEPVDIIS